MPRITKNTKINVFKLRLTGNEENFKNILDILIDMGVRFVYAKETGKLTHNIHWHFMLEPLDKTLFKLTTLRKRVSRTVPKGDKGGNKYYSTERCNEEMPLGYLSYIMKEHRDFIGDLMEQQGDSKDFNIKMGTYKWNVEELRTQLVKYWDIQEQEDKFSRDSKEKRVEKIIEYLQSNLVFDECVITDGQIEYKHTQDKRMSKQELIELIKKEKHYIRIGEEDPLDGYITSFYQRFDYRVSLKMVYDDIMNVKLQLYPPYHRSIQGAIQEMRMKDYKICPVKDIIFK